MSTEILGTTENGARVDVVFPFKTGKVGKQVRGDLVEIAYPGEAPKDLPIVGTIEGASCTAIAARTVNVDGLSKSRSPRTMAVVTVRLDAPEA